MMELYPSAEVWQEVADGTSATQQLQVETAIDNGADALVAAADPPTSGGLLEVAASAGVPVSAASGGGPLVLAVAIDLVITRGSIRPSRGRLERA